MAGPEEMKWPQKELYTYNVRNGDKFILDEKVNLPRMRTNSGKCEGKTTRVLKPRDSIYLNHVGSFC